MPKLSKNSLEKRFACQHCGKSLRTRQGLSGHIQFKHGDGQKSLEVDGSTVPSKVKEIAMFGAAWKLPSSGVKARQIILANWLEVQALCKFLNIKLSPQDFKNYFIVRLAQIHDKEM